MEHNEAVRLQMTAQYLLEELSPEAREEFEEHYFTCGECAAEVSAGVAFVEQSKVEFAKEAQPRKEPEPVIVRPGWRDWFRPVLVLPVFTTLLLVFTYQNLVLIPKVMEAANHPQVLPWTTVNVGTFGSEGQAIAVRSGQGFMLLLRIPPQDGYSSYTANLYDPNQKLEWTVTVPSAVAHDSTAHDAAFKDQWALQVPGSRRKAGSYSVVVRGQTHDGGSEEVGRGAFELQVE
jgi:Putative zinc-finger